MKLCALFLAVILLAACHSEDETADTIQVPVRLSVVTGSPSLQRAPADPGTAEKFALPSHAYIYVLTYSQPQEQGTAKLIYQGTDGHIALDPAKWKQDTTTPEIYHYTGDINLFMPTDMMSGRVLAAVSSEKIEDLSFSATTPATFDALSRMTYSVPSGSAETQNEYMKNLYSTPYNLVYKYDAASGKLVGSPLDEDENGTDKLYYGTILDAAEKVSHVNVVLYHVATRLDVKWEVDPALRKDNALTFFEVCNLPQKPCYLFRPTENVNDKDGANTTYSGTQCRSILNTSKAEYNLDPSTYWQGRRVMYVPQHYLRQGGMTYYPFDVRLGVNGVPIEDETSTPEAGKYYGQKFSFKQAFMPHKVFTSWIAVGVNVKTQINN